MFVTGKGGVGKSYVSFQIAKELAGSGKRVALIESSLIGGLAPYVDLSKKIHTWGLGSFGIRHINLDARSNFSDFIDDQFKNSRILKAMLNTALVRTFLEVIPGLSDLLMLGRICQEASSTEFDHVVFDGASSGHFFQMLATPMEVMRADVIGPVKQKTSKILELLKSSDFAEVCFVSLAKDLVVQETVEFLGKFKELGYPEVGQIVLNRFTGLTQDDLKFSNQNYPESTSALKYLEKVCLSENLAQSEINKFPEFRNIRFEYEKLT